MDLAQGLAPLLPRGELVVPRSAPWRSSLRLWLHGSHRRMCGACAEFWASSARNLGRSTVAWCWWRVKGLEQRRPLACFIHRPSDRAAGSRGVRRNRVREDTGHPCHPWAPLAGSQKLRRAACQRRRMVRAWDTPPGGGRQSPPLPPRAGLSLAAPRPDTAPPPPRPRERAGCQGCCGGYGLGFRAERDLVAARRSTHAAKQSGVNRRLNTSRS